MLEALFDVNLVQVESLLDEALTNGQNLQRLATDPHDVAGQPAGLGPDRALVAE